MHGLLQRKWGKKNSIVAGLILSGVGGLFAMTDMSNFKVVVLGCFCQNPWNDSCMLCYDGSFCGRSGLPGAEKRLPL